jgi:methylphosphotriester-DNA--protein-cysteine methyltransferase
LAAEAHVSRASLVRIFRKTAGVAPLAFLTDLRLGLARQRLASTEVSVARSDINPKAPLHAPFNGASKRRLAGSGPRASDKSVSSEQADLPKNLNVH